MEANRGTVEYRELKRGEWQWQGGLTTTRRDQSSVWREDILSTWLAICNCLLQTMHWQRYPCYAVCIHAMPIVSQKSIERLHTLMCALCDRGITTITTTTTMHPCRAWINSLLSPIPTFFLLPLSFHSFYFFNPSTHSFRSPINQELALILLLTFSSFFSSSYLVYTFTTLVTTTVTATTHSLTFPSPSPVPDRPLVPFVSLF